MIFRSEKFALLCAPFCLLASLAAPIEANPAAPTTTETKIPTPATQPFLFVVEDVFSITGRGPVATGRVTRGQIKVGDEIEVVGNGETRKFAVANLELSRKSANSVESGDNCAIILRGAKREDIKRGHVLATPDSIGAHREFKAEITLLSNEEGGRRTPIFKNYRPQFTFHASDVTGTLTDLGGAELRNPGDKFGAEITLIESVALENGLTFNIREGGRIVGKGVVLEVKKADVKPTP